MPQFCLLNHSGLLTAIIILAIWTAPWTVIALWKAARRKDYVWFVIFAIIHTAGILDIIYIFLISKNKPEV
jgi:hypothetical protein